MNTKPQPLSAGKLRASIADQVVPCAKQDAKDLFFEPDGENHNRELPAAKALRERSARSLCASCPVRELCLDLARMELPEYGIWGGLTAKEIRNELKDAA